MWLNKQLAEARLLAIRLKTYVRSLPLKSNGMVNDEQNEKRVWKQFFFYTSVQVNQQIEDIQLEFFSFRIQWKETRRIKHILFNNSELF